VQNLKLCLVGYYYKTGKFKKRACLAKEAPMTVSRDQIMHWLEPWKWAPLIVLAAMQFSFGFLYIGGVYLVIPIAVYLTLRYGKAGWLVVAVMGIPLLGRIFHEDLNSVSAVGVYLSAVLIGWWLQSQRRVQDILPGRRLTPWIYSGFLLLPLAIGLGGTNIPLPYIWWLVDIGKRVDLFPLFFLLVFVIGLGRVPQRPVLTALSVAVLFGLLLWYLDWPKNAAQWLGADAAELPWFGLTDLKPLYVVYLFDTPAEYLTAIGFFFLGGYFARQYDQGELSLPNLRQRSLLLLLVVLIGFGGEINNFLFPDHGQALQLMGSFYGIILASLLAGLYFRFNGILAMCFIVTAFWWIDGVLHADLDFIEPHFNYRLDYLLYAYGYGLLGIIMRDKLSQTTTNLWSAAWFRYLLVFLLLLVSVITLETRYVVLFIALAFFTGIAFTMWISHVRDQLAGTDIVIKGGWLSLVSLIMMGFLVYNFSAGNWQALQEIPSQALLLVQQVIVANEAVGEEDMLMLGIVVAACLITVWLLISTFTMMYKSSRKMISEVRAILVRWRSKIPIRISIGKYEQQFSRDQAARVDTYVMRALTWGSRGVLACIIVLPLVMYAYNDWLDHQESLARERERAERHNDFQPSEEMQRRDRERKEAREQLVNRLVIAAQTVLEDFPNVQVKRDYRTTITTDWHSEPNEPQTRRRLSINISPDLHFRDMSPERALRSSLQVSAYQQSKGRFGLWVVQNQNYRDEWEYADNIEAKIESIAVSSLTGE